MSELVREYPHVVIDPTKDWRYFDIPSCLKMLSWSVAECYAHVWPQWIENSSLTRHAVVQLALYTCLPFRDATPGHIIDYFNHTETKPRQYPCRSVPGLIEALATALMDYEFWCEHTYRWQYFQAKQDACVAFLLNVIDLRNALKKRRFTAEDQLWWHNKALEGDIQKMIAILRGITETDYQHAGGPTDTPHDPRAQLNKVMLLTAMNEAFKVHMEWPQQATYRALAAIMNQMQICNAKVRDWTPEAIKKILMRGPDQRLKFTINLTRPNIKPWYTRREYLEDNEVSCP